jgi:hypothetical protein
MSTLAYEGTLPNGVTYRIHQATSFSSHCELAIEIGGQFASVIAIETKKGGAIECKTTQTNRIKIAPPATVEQAPSASFSDDSFSNTPDQE